MSKFSLSSSAVAPLIAVTPEGTLRGTLDTEEAAEYLGLKPKTLLNLRLQGLGPRATKLGRRVVYRLADLEEYLLANRESA